MEAEALDSLGDILFILISKVCEKRKKEESGECERSRVEWVLIDYI